MEIDHVHQCLYMSLGLHERARHAKSPHSLFVLGQEARNDGVIRPFSRCQIVGAGLIKAEIAATILEIDARSRNHDTGTKILVVALDQAHHRAFLVRCTQMHGTAAVRVAVSRHHRPVTDQGCPLFQVSLRYHLLHRDFRIIRVCNITLSIRKGQLQRLDLLMDRPYIIMSHRRGLFQHAQRHQRHQALTIGRQLPHIVAPVGYAYRIYPVGPVAFQIFFAKKAARFLRKSVDLVCQRPVIEGQASAFRNGFQCVGDILGAPNLACLRRSSILCKYPEPLFELFPICVGRHFLSGFPPAGRRHRLHRESTAGTVDGRIKVFPQAQSAKPLVQLCPGRGNARYRHRQPPALRHFVKALLPHNIRGQKRRCRTAGIECIQASVPPHLHKTVPADAVGGWLCHYQAGRRRNGRVHRVAASFQNTDSSLRSQWL